MFGGKHSAGCMQLLLFFRLAKRNFLSGGSALLLALLLTGPAAGQHRPAVLPTRPATDSLAQAAREDTTYAVQRLFRQRRHHYRLRAAIWGAATGFSAIFPAVGLLRQAEYKPNLLGLAALAYSLGNFGYNCVKLHPYRVRRERKLLQAIQAGQPLPAKVRRQLDATYFDAPTSSR